MSTKTQTNTGNVYNRSAMGAYNAFQPMLQSQLMQMAQNPFGTPGFQAQMGYTSALNNQLSQRATSTMMKNLKTGGGILSNAGGLTNALAQRGALNASQTASQGFQNALSSALNNRNYALGAMENYQPLQTGSNTTQTQSGLGTWLPQVAGMAANAFMPGLGAMMGGGSFSSGYGGGAVPFNQIGGYTPSRINMQGPPPPQYDMSGMANGYNPFLNGAY